MSCRKFVRCVVWHNETLPGLPAAEYGVRLRNTEDGVQASLGSLSMGDPIDADVVGRTYPKRPRVRLFVNSKSCVNFRSARTFESTRLCFHGRDIVNNRFYNFDSSPFLLRWRLSNPLGFEVSQWAFRSCVYWFFWFDGYLTGVVHDGSQATRSPGRDYSCLRGDSWNARHVN